MTQVSPPVQAAARPEGGVAIELVVLAVVMIWMEYGCASYIASFSGGLMELDVVQRRAENSCGVTFQPLGARREALEKLLVWG